jgi:hypothetical protein
MKSLVTLAMGKGVAVVIGSPPALAVPAAPDHLKLPSARSAARMA